MSAEDFLDTNIFVYMFDATDDFKRQRAEELVQRSLSRGTGCISYQVVQETLNVATRKLGFLENDSRTLLTDILAPLWTVHPSASLYELGLQVRGRYGFSFYDSIIVASAIESGCTRLFSEDLQHGQRVESLTVENPFRTS
jgi:predicted nucleic acid-binding protein